MKHLIRSEIDILKEKRAMGVLPDSIGLLNTIREKKFTIKDLGINYRWLNHWDSKGLLIGDYEESKWRKFNLSQYVWLKIVIKIREFNISLDTVKMVKEALDFNFTGEDLMKTPNLDWLEMISQFAPHGKEEIAKELLNSPELIKEIGQMPSNFLEMIILDILSLGNSYSILIDSKSKVLLLKYSYLEMYSDIPEFKDIWSGSYISISITEILKDFVVKNELDRNNKKRLAVLTEEEFHIIDIVRKDDLKSVIIRYGRDKKMNLLEEIREEKVDKGARLVDIMMKYGYQDLTVKTQNGKIVYCENKRKTIINP